MAADAAILENRSAWKPFMDRYVADSTDVWGGSQQAQCIAAVMRSSAPNASATKFREFYT